VFVYNDDFVQTARLFLWTKTITTRYTIYTWFSNHCRNYVMLTYMQHVKRLALMHRIITAAVPW